MATKGVVFFNFGTECGLRMLVTMYTLRKVYDGNAVLQLAKGDKHNDRLKEEAEAIGIPVEFYDLNRICKRNLKSVMAPKALKISPFTASIQIDADTSFRYSPQQILDWCEEYGILVTHFCGWISSGNIMSGRIKSIADLISPQDLEGSLDKKPAINCGVVGYCKGKADDFQVEWDDLTNRGAGRFIMEEIACQCVYWKYKHKVAPIEWNTSCVWGDLETAKIIHYHGHKHTGLHRKMSRYWWAELGWGIEDGAFSRETIKFWADLDRDAKPVIDEMDFAHIDSAKEEFKKYRLKREKVVV